jgi:hypothetical protein
MDFQFDSSRETSSSFAAFAASLSSGRSLALLVAASSSFLSY